LKREKVLVKYRSNCECLRDLDGETQREGGAGKGSMREGVSE
jgi:hypothetical protein